MIEQYYTCDFCRERFQSPYAKSVNVSHPDGETTTYAACSSVCYGGLQLLVGTLQMAQAMADLQRRVEDLEQRVGPGVGGAI